MRAGVPSMLAVVPDIAARGGHCRPPAGDSYRWMGTFHVPVAFKDPSAVWKVLGGTKLITEWSGIELEEVRL
jgi:hypothetical protein